MRKFATDLSLQIFFIHYISRYGYDLSILVANLTTTFQDLVTKVKN